MKIQENVQLSPHTTMKLGGPARYFATCTTVEEVREALAFARSSKFPIHILGGGSNTLFTDQGYPGVILQIALKGIEFRTENNYVIVTAQAGEKWDPLVARCVEQGFAGLECLSGIPGLVGATPIQNVGAYGQAVSDTIAEVTTLERTTQESRTFTGQQCMFDYRTSRFKQNDAGRYIVLSVTYRLKSNGEPTIKYPQVRAKLEERGTAESLGRGPKALQQVRDTVLALRRSKSMVLDESDPNTQSCGSFFINPLLTERELTAVKKHAEKNNIDANSMPVFPSGKKVKLSAAWLIESAGFKRGQRQGGVGISANHALALVNYSGTTKELLAFADEIVEKIHDTFGIRLEREPVLVAA